jgi:integrating conjugative element protein (TIGR03759 family)
MRSRIPPTLLLPIVCLALCAPSLATQEQTTRAQDSESAQSGSGISAEERTLAAQWGLTEVEWQRYRHLMRGLRGSLSVSTISPVEVLGIHADSESDRTRYAEMFVRLMQQDTERVLAFERAYHAAWRRLFPDIPVIDRGLLEGDGSASEQSAVPALLNGDRILYFAKPQCPACDAALVPLLERLHDAEGWGIDIYLVGTAGDDAAVRRWAEAQRIPTRLVASRAITLNHDDGALARLVPEASPPQILHRRGQSFTVMELRQ